MNVKLTAEQKIKMEDTADLYPIMQQILMRENRLRRAQEHFWIMGFNNANKLVFIELISLGANNSVQVKPPEIFRMAIYKLATSVVLVHNHPSGNLVISDSDYSLTDRLIKTGEIINIEVLDHLVISETEYVSFEEKGLMDELRQLGTYRLHTEETEKMRALQMDVQKVKAADEKTKEIAGKLKKQGMSERMIKKVTGLALWEIRKLEEG